MKLRGFWCIRTILRLLGISALLLSLAGCAAPKEYSGQQFLMDTIVEITVYSESMEKSRDGAQAAFNAIKEIEDLTDRFAQEGAKAFEVSDVCRINSMAGIQPVKVSHEVLEMVSMAKEYHRITEGAFDITVGPLMDLWGFGTDPAVPGEEAIREKLKLVGMDKVIIDEEKKTVFLSQKGMTIDLGGIAKGYAAERGAEVLREKGIQQGIVNAGGNVVVLGEKRLKEPWKLGIQDPRDENRLIGVLALNDQAAVTSGDYQRYFEREGRRYHHLLDPATGMPAGETISVTVVCDSSAVADILSTALFVLGPEEGIRLAGRLDGVEALFVGKDKRITVTRGIREIITVSPGEDYSYDQKG